jgi:carbon-monoxide dehydrogenase medium subunit
MKPAPFAYHRPESREQVDRLLAELGDDAKILAGGQSLIPILNMRLGAPEHLIDINGLQDEPVAPVVEDEVMRFGPLVRHAALEGADGLLGEAISYVGHAAIRSRGTVVGSIAHADPAAELPAVAVALDAELVVHGPGGERMVRADEFFVTHYTTALNVDEILTEVRLPDRGSSAWAFGEVSRRHGDFALAGVALAADADGDGVISSARIALFGVADRPVRATAAEDSLVGQRLGDEQAARDAGRLATEGIEFTSDIHVPEAYRRDAAQTLVRRALLDAANTLEG